jgi:hypothetical protein
MVNNSTILDRFKRYKKINELISKNIKSSQDECLIHSKDRDFLYSFNNNIFIIKKIGLESSDASIWLSEIKTKSSKSYYFISKIQLFTDFIEKIFLERASKYAIETKNIHLPLYYGYLKCNKFNKFDLLLPNNININKKLNAFNYNNEKSTTYYSIFAELADGDIIKYTNDILMSSNMLYNAIAQCFMALISFHNIGIFHRDSHLGNFLYHKVASGGCIEYKYRDLIFYIENIGYNWVIWDFGRSIEIKNEKDIYEDFSLLIESILDERLYQDGIISRYYGYNSYKEGLKILLKIIENSKNDYLIIKKIIENNMLFSKIPIGKIITTVHLK